MLAIIGALGFLVSIFNAVFTVRNARDARANRDEIQGLDAKNKARAIRLEEFRTSVRDPIKAASAELSPFIRRLTAVANTRTSIDELADQIRELNTEAFELIGGLIDALVEANRSKFASGEDWTARVYEYEDSVGNAFNDALDADKPHVARLSAVREAGEQLATLRKLVNDRIDERLEHFANLSEQAPRTRTG